MSKVISESFNLSFNMDDEAVNYYKQCMENGERINLMTGPFVCGYIVVGSFETDEMRGIIKFSFLRISK